MTFFSTLRPVSIVALLATAMLFFQSGELFGEWPATQFQVQTREPVTVEKAEIQQELEAGMGTFDSLIDSVVELTNSDGQQVTNKAERWMNEIGDLYRNGGHQAPYIQPIVQDNGIAKYRVYIFPFSGSRTRSTLAYTGGGYQLSDCSGSSRN